MAPYSQEVAVSFVTNNISNENIKKFKHPQINVSLQNLNNIYLRILLWMRMVSNGGFKGYWRIDVRKTENAKVNDKIETQDTKNGFFKSIFKISING